MHGTQPGDPAKAAAALIEAVESDEPPFMLLLGNDASDGFRAALDALRAEVDAWESAEPEHRLRRLTASPLLQRSCRAAGQREGDARRRRR